MVWDGDVDREVVRWSVLDTYVLCESGPLEVVVNGSGSIVCFF